MAIVEDQYITIKWNGNNRKIYEELGYKYTKLYDEFTVPLKHLNKNSKALVKANCDYCNKEFKRAYQQFNRKGRKNDNCFCSKECTDNHKRETKENSGHRVERFKINCKQCNKEIERTQAEINRAKNNFCTKTCADEYMIGKERKDLQTRIKVNCSNCNKELERPPHRIDNHKNQFCNHKCYGEWIVNTGAMKKEIKAVVKVDCYTCGKEIEKKKYEYENSKTGRFYCGRGCLNKDKKTWDFLPQSQKGKRVTVNCSHCEKELKVKPNVYKKNKWHFCSRECYYNFRSEELTGEKVYNYNSVKMECYTCKKEILVNESKRKKNDHFFCSHDCYQQVRLEVVDYKFTRTGIHLKINDILDKNKIKHKDEKGYKYWSVDISLEDCNLLVEIMGDYWHGTPLKYTYDQLNQTQITKVRSDKAKRTYIINKFNINILYLWEKDIDTNIELCEKLIKLYISNNGILEDYNSFNYSLIDGELSLNKNIIKPFFMRNMILVNN